MLSTPPWPQPLEPQSMEDSLTEKAFTSQRKFTTQVNTKDTLSIIYQMDRKSRHDLKVVYVDNERLCLMQGYCLPWTSWK